VFEEEEEEEEEQQQLVPPAQVLFEAMAATLPVMSVMYSFTTLEGPSLCLAAQDCWHLLSESILWLLSNVQMLLLPSSPSVCCWC
jgi:hypothetical protein